MRALSPAVLEALEAPATLIVTCWEILRRDGIAIRLTDHDQPIIIAGETYRPNGSAERTAVALSDGLSADNLDVAGVFSSELITENDLFNGHYDYAEIRLLLAFADRDLAETIPLARGRFGEIEFDNSAYRVQINGLTHALQAQVGEVTTATCRATFGDARCRVPLASWQRTYALASVSDARTMTLAGSSLLSTGTYSGGILEVMDGAAAGMTMEIRDWTHPNIVLALPLPIVPAAGDMVRLTAGCNRTRLACAETFGNIVNFVGEPDIPGMDALMDPEVES